LQAGDVCKAIALVPKGYLRSYAVDHKREEHIVQSAFEVWWGPGMKSFLTNRPAIFNIDAVENSELL